MPSRSMVIRTTRLSSCIIKLLAMALLLSLPTQIWSLDMPPMSDMSASKRHTSQFQAKQNHPTSYDDSPAFRGPIKLDRTVSTSSYHVRIRNYYAQQGWDLPTEPLKPLSTKASTKTMLQTIVDQLAYRDAPIDVKELTESIEFYLRTRKRLLGSAGKKLMKNGDGADEASQSNVITVYDLCSGHGLTGMLFVACNPPKETIGSPLIQTMLVDQTEPPSHQILRTMLAEVCPWLSKGASVRFAAESLDSFEEATAQDEPGIHTTTAVTLAISTHACGSLTDQVLKFAVQQGACGIAVMPCCYTGTDKGAPYGVKRALGVSWAADIRRSFFLTEHGYHSDFATIPSEITPMNRILVGEKRV